MISKRMTAILPYIWGFFLWIVFLFFQAQGISGGDSGDLVTAAYEGGVPHPPGYPLYTAMGHILRFLPLSTFAWRMSLLSSFFHAATALVVFLFVWKLSGRMIAGLFSSVVLMGNYLFFLYSITPEVFALFDFFLIALTYLLYLKRYDWASFVLGLSLSHHHVILFFVPTLLYWGFKWKKYILVGLLPYLYIPIAARTDAIINWDRPVDLSNFIRLVSRADYGTFVSSGFYGSEFSVRMLQVKTYLRFLVVDLTWFGLFLAILGFLFLWKKNKRVANGIIFALFFLGPVFFFYASFPLINRFTVGTYERFLLPSYVFFAILIGLGFDSILRVSLWKTNFVKMVCTILLFLYPVSTLGMTVWRFWGIAPDRTAENLARDILEGVPKDAVLLMQRDTPLFSTQYVRYVLGFRPDIKLIHSSRLPSPDYPLVLQKVFPDLYFPQSKGDEFVSQFIEVNSKIFPMVSITRLPTPKGWVWVPHGLVFLLTKESAVPSIDELIDMNEVIWKNFHNPQDGILRRYDHLMLSDVRDVYATGKIELGKTLLRANKLDEAKKQFEQALLYDGDTQKSDTYVYLGLTQLFQEECVSALTNFEKAKEISYTKIPNIILYEAHAYRDCGNRARADELFAAFEKEQSAFETPLAL